VTLSSAGSGSRAITLTRGGGLLVAQQRGRAVLAQAAPREDTMRRPGDRAVGETAERYIRAFEAADVDALVTLLTDDAVMEMPPVPLWYSGRADYGTFIARVFRTRGTGWRMIRTGGERPACARGVLPW
jgi:RNA polymerase sigma-70 factor, ECF subfamily